ncbi:hypothetical protein KFK09_019335 [Dendrobium nobile]|uniref:FCP1 homology domain-containing protein n=1 Tax=Dendrobium nobile TaxID=94219 RepID=A0A8T3APZ0_DENNO|nr:hypothetical protein KFK09_019335 [Dendrobium nobile]
MSKRAFMEVSGHHLEQQRSKRKEDGHTVYGADGMEHDEDNVEKNGCIAFLNEIHAKIDSAGKISEASVIRSFSSQKECGSSDAVLDKEDVTLADSSSCSERCILFSAMSSHLVTDKDCQRSNVSQSDQASLSEADQAFTSSDCSSEVTHAATMNKHLSSDLSLIEKDRLPENLDIVIKGNIIHEEFENHIDLMSTSLKTHNPSMKRRKDNMPDVTEYGSERKFCQEPSFGDTLVGALERNSIPVDITACYPDSNKLIHETNFSSNNSNSGVIEIAGAILEMQNNINDETASQSSLNEGSSIKGDALEKDIVDRTLNHPSCSAEIVRQHNIYSMPPQTECGNDENTEKAFQKTVHATVSDKINCTMHEENISERSFSSAISIEINQKALYANFKGELSFPPSPITGVIDCFVGKPNGDSNHLDSFNEEDTAFSFQTPNKCFSKKIPKNEIGFEMHGVVEGVVESYDCSQNLMVHPLKDVSIDIHGDRVTEQKERVTSVSFSSAMEDDLLLKEKKKEVQEIGSVPPERLLACRTKRKLLVLDLNGLLCDIVNDYYNSYRVEKKVGGKPFFKRPFCDDFLKFCFDHFHIGIWSSRRKYNVDSALDYLLEEFKHKLLFCWDQSKCTYTGARTIENHHKPLVLKELKKLWNKEESDLPWQKGDFSPSNTLLLDDSPYKALCNPPNTAIFPYPYRYTDERDNSLGPGGDIRVYLENLLISDDVQHFVEEHPFGQPAITTSDEHWYFYSQIIKSNDIQLS